MRLSAILAIAGTFLAAATLSVISARIAATVVEDTSEKSVRAELDDAGVHWAEVDTNGLQIFLAGTTPSEASRFKALSAARAVVDAARVIDQMLVRERDDIAPPRFSIEILRNESGVSLIGLVPASMDRAGFVAEVRAASDGAPVADFLESADHPTPETWEAATRYALRSLKDLDRTKISVDAKRVAVTAMTESAAAKAEIEADLSRRVPEDIKLALNISAPRPVITPFTLRFVIDDGEARFDACSADTEAARKRIVAAARAAGLEGGADCVIGLGVPSPKWGAAAERAIEALARLGEGKLTFTDADISLVAAQGTAEKRFDDVVGTLESDLPEVFALHATLPEPPDESAPETPEFTATLSPEGLVQLRGRVASAADRKLIDSFARARFTSDGVHMTARVADGLPEEWTLRILAGLDALSHLSNGAVRVMPDDLSIRGATGQSEAGTAISGLLSEKLGKGAQFTIDVRYEEALDPVANLPTPKECEERIAAVQEERKITFEPGSARIDPEGAEIMDRIAEILKDCGEITMEIGGHTDSQGREVMNQRLSQERAQTVLNELRMRRVLTASISAVGYGESQPIADNGTEEGRAANRRIEFDVITPEDLAEAETTAQADTEVAAEQEQEPAGNDTEAGNEAQEEPSDEQD
ncbi:OmpA family protein [Roseovarius salis]|uniref:OmpA family protein n=1 Tax=Roseovarius salis TaxID=3376063 RepID=UPI0037CBB717